MTDIPYERLSRFLALLDGKCRYAVVKNPDLWNNLRRGGDWDILVSDLSDAQTTLVEALGYPRRITRRSYVVAHFYDWGEVDLLPRLEWRGVQLIENDRLFAHTTRDSGGWRVSTPAHQAVMGWIGPLLASGSFSYKHVATVRQAVVSDSAELKFVLSALFGKKLGAILWLYARGDRLSESVALVPAIRRAALYRASTMHPIQTFLGTCRLLRCELQLRYRPTLPFLATRSEDEVAAAVQWFASRRTSIRGVALLDATGIQLFDHTKLASDTVDWMLPTPVTTRAHRTRLCIRERLALASLQTRGWLIASSVGLYGFRFSNSALLGTPLDTRVTPELLGDFLDSYLSRETVRTMTGEIP